MTSSTFTDVTRRSVRKLTQKGNVGNVAENSLETRNSPKSISLKVKFCFC